MAVYRKPKKKYARRFGLVADERKTKKAARKKTDYGLRLEEKQKLKFIYRILERQLRRYVEEALKSHRDPADVILETLETRLDNVVYRLGFAKTRPQARQLVSHGSILVDGRKVTIPSYNVQPGQIISLKEGMGRNPMVQEALNQKKPESLPSWLRREESRGHINAYPSKGELRQDVNMSYIIEFYS